MKMEIKYSLKKEEASSAAYRPSSQRSKESGLEISNPAQKNKLQSLLPPPLSKDFFREAIQHAFEEQTSVLGEIIRTACKRLSDEVCDLMETLIQQIREDIVDACKGLASKVISLEDRVEEINQSNENLESKFALRIRGLKENNQENLKEILAEAFDQLIGQPRAEYDWQIDKIYRVNSWTARQRQLPRDIIIYFATRNTRNLILQASYKTKLQIAGQEVLVLKEIPPKMFGSRKDYASLVDELRNRRIQYRWEFPAGLVVNYSGQRYHLNSVWKARDFYNNVLKAGYPPSPGFREREEAGEARQQDIQGSMDAAQAFNLLVETEGIMEQRQTLAATKHKEQELKMQQVQTTIQETTNINTEAVGGARPKMKLQDFQVALEKLQLKMTIKFTKSTTFTT